MAKANDHSKVLSIAAREVLQPLGLFQKGRSRIWIHEQGWWIGVVEFQPSSWSKRSYLNVGVMWLWDEKDHFSFDVGNRVASHVKYVDDDQFRAESFRLAELARDEIIKYRKMFAAIEDAESYLVAHAIPSNPWTIFHAGVACGCAGHARKAWRYFEQINQQAAQYPWETVLHDKASRLNRIVADRDKFRRYIEEVILVTRRLLKLPEVLKVTLPLM